MQAGHLFFRQMYRYVNNRELDRQHFDQRKLIPKHLVNYHPYSSRIYNSQFTQDGNYCFISTQDHRIAFYDTSDIKNFTKLFSLKASFGQWTITDYSLSSNNRFMAYSSLVPFIHLAEISVDGSSLCKGIHCPSISISNATNNRPPESFIIVRYRW